MRYDPKRHHRRSIRLKGYDYSGAGAYFLTICTQNRECLFGKIVNGKMVLNDAGQAADECWRNIPHHFPHAVLDEYVIMPNHIHGIIFLKNTGAVGAKTMGGNVGAKYTNVGTNVGAKNFSPLRGRTHAPRAGIHPRGTSKTIGSIVRGFKIGVTKWMRQNTHVKTVWQRNYWEHIVRDENELNRIRQYIIDNPAKWELDRNYAGKQNTIRETMPRYNHESWMV